MVEAGDLIAIYSKRKAISALLPYAIRLPGDGQQKMIGALSGTHRTSIFTDFVWDCVELRMTVLLNEPRTPSPDRVITLVSPYLDWNKYNFDRNTVTRWSTAVLATLAVPYTEEVGQTVVDTLWRIASVDTLRQHIPVGIWLWSSNQTFIPPAWSWHHERDPRGWEATRQFRALGDIEILKSYLLLVWLDWAPLHGTALVEMCTSIREDIDGIGMGQHRQDLRKRLDHVLEQLARGQEYLYRHRPDLYTVCRRTTKDQYRELKRVLLEVDGEAMQTLTRTSSRMIILFDLLTSVGTYRISLDVHV